MNAPRWPNANAFPRRATLLSLQSLRFVAALVRRLSKVLDPPDESRGRPVFRYRPVLLRSTHPPNATKKVMGQGSRLSAGHLVPETGQDAAPEKMNRSRCQ